MSARYLLRLDDACPTMVRTRWQRLETLFDELGIRPIVAVVPDNRDPYLDQAAPDDAFWTRTQGWQAKGWTIALHGYQHVLRPVRAREYLPLYGRSEFAGLSLGEQTEKIRRGWELLKANGLTPTMWVAPAHSFDRTTLKAVEAETPIRTVSDGVARDQYFADGFHWLPQQLWSLAPKRAGLWTVCLHPNTMNDAAFDELEQQLRGRYRGAIVGIGDVQLTRRARSLGDRIESVNFWRRHYSQRGVGLIKKIVRR